MSWDERRVSMYEVVQSLRVYMLALYSYHRTAFYGAFRKVQAYE